MNKSEVIKQTFEKSIKNFVEYWNAWETIGITEIRKDGIVYNRVIQMNSKTGEIRFIDEYVRSLTN